jgi:hypothetical protein
MQVAVKVSVLVFFSVYREVLEFEAWFLVLMILFLFLVPQQDFTEFYHADEAITYITDYMKLHGPYDGLIGFSQVKKI